MGPNPHVVHLGQPGARVVLGAGEGKRRVLADSTHRWIEQDDTVPDPRQVRQAGALEPFEQRQRHRMVVHVDRCGVDVGRVSRLAVVGLVRCASISSTSSGSNSMLAARVVRSHAFLLDGTSPSSPTVASWSHATLRSSGCQHAGSDVRSSGAATPTTETNQGGRNGSDAELHPGCRGGRRANQSRRASACWR